MSAPHRHDEVGILLDPVVLDRLGDELVQDAVAAAGAVVHVGLDRTGAAVERVEEDFRPAEFDFFAHLDTSFQSLVTSSQTSLQLGMLPPMRWQRRTGLRQRVASSTSSII